MEFQGPLLRRILIFHVAPELLLLSCDVLTKEQKWAHKISGRNTYIPANVLSTLQAVSYVVIREPSTLATMFISPISLVRNWGTNVLTNLREIFQLIQDGTFLKVNLQIQIENLHFEVNVKLCSGMFNYLRLTM